LSGISIIFDNQMVTYHHQTIWVKVTLNFLPARLSGGVSGSYQYRDAETQPAGWQEVQHDTVTMKVENT